MVTIPTEATQGDAANLGLRRGACYRATSGSTGWLAMLKGQSPAENRGAFDSDYRDEEMCEAFRPWQAWQRPTLPSLET